MIKSKLDFKLINIALIALICYFIYKSYGFWLNIIDKFIDIILPIFLGFVLAYALNPVLNYFEKHKIPKYFGIFLIVLIILFIIVSTLILLIPILSNQILSFLDYIVLFIKNVNINSDMLNILNKVISEIGIYLSNGVVKTISTSINVITNAVIMFVSSIYFLLDMDKIRNYLKKYFKKKSMMLYNYFKVIDIEMRKYIDGFLKIVLISFFEYTCFYYFISHPNALLLGLLSSLSNFIPYFGGMIVQILAVITSLVISKTLGIKVIILTLLLSFFDSYILNPLIYGKSNQIHPIIIITSVFAGGILFGFIGVIISLPISIIIMNSIKFYYDNKSS